MNRDIVDHLAREFENLISTLKTLINSISPDLIYQDCNGVSIGENILRSAAIIEQTCGGLTSNLWDDPFEWTLPETLSNADRMTDYLCEVELARQRAFNAIGDDGALSKYISCPSGEPRLLISTLMETLVKAVEYKGRAVATIKMLSGEGTPRFII